VADQASPALTVAGAPPALLADAVLLLVSALILRGIRVTEDPPRGDRFLAYCAPDAFRG
jgi:hypothetical protein